MCAVCFVPSAVSQYDYALQFSGSTVGSEAYMGRDVHSLSWYKCLYTNSNILFFNEVFVSWHSVSHRGPLLVFNRSLDLNYGFTVAPITCVLKNYRGSAKKFMTRSKISGQHPGLSMTVITIFQSFCRQDTSSLTSLTFITLIAASWPVFVWRPWTDKHRQVSENM